MPTIVKTQAEFDSALAALNGAHGVIEIRSSAGVWITVEAFGSATVRAFGSATVRAFDSATVRAFGSATVEAFDSATVRAFGSATVEAFDSATVRAFGSATVRAFGSATVEAFDSATVEAFDSATVRATPHVAVHLHAKTAVVEGGVLIDVTGVNDTGWAWLEHHGIEVADSGLAIVFKAVDDNWTTPRGFDYSPGAQVEAPDWDNSHNCGGGLHFGPSPTQAKVYHPTATRFVACQVPANELRAIPGGTAKVKAPSCDVLYEVDIDGNRIGDES